MNKTIVWVVVVFLVLGAGWYLLKGANTYPVAPDNSEVTVEQSPDEIASKDESSASADSMTKEGFQTVAYTELGFTPKTLTIKKGSKVTFVNASNKDMWVASAIHPTHQELPGFDELESVGRGEKYEFTFAKVGTWKFHNHVSPSDTGSVTVTE